MGQMVAMMAGMQRTIDALTLQLANLEKGGSSRDHVGKEDDMPVMHYKDVDKPSKFG